VIYYQTVQLVIFLPTFNATCMRPKVDVMERVKKLRIWVASKQALKSLWEHLDIFRTPLEERERTCVKK
jgi:hypothetical protein